MDEELVQEDTSFEKEVVSPVGGVYQPSEEVQEESSAHWLEEAQKLFDKANEGKLARLHRAVIEDAHNHYYKVVSKLQEVAGIDTASIIMRDHQYHEMLKQFVMHHNVVCETLKHIAEKMPNPVLIQDGETQIDENRDIIKKYIAIGEGDLPYQTKHYVAAGIYIAATLNKLNHKLEALQESNAKLTENLGRQIQMRDQLSEEVSTFRAKALNYKQELDRHFPIIHGLCEKVFLYNETDFLWLGLSKNTENVENPTISDFVKVKDPGRAYDFRTLENARNIQTKIANRKALSKVKEIENFIIVKSVYQNLGQ